MRVDKVVSLRNFGIFRDYSWPTDLEPFKRFNLIYGWNRSGKTTLSRVFTACEKKTTAFNQYPKTGQFTVATGSNRQLTDRDLSATSLSIRVFNKDFIDENISFEPSISCNPIVLISKEDIEGQKELEVAQKEEQARAESYQAAKADTARASKAEERFLTATALIVKRTVGNLKVRDIYYAYDRGQLSRVLTSRSLDSFSLLDDQAVDDHRKMIASEAKAKLPLLYELELPQAIVGGSISNFQAIGAAVNELVVRKVASDSIDRLKKDPDLNAWVEHGLELHKRDSGTRCLFCEQPLPEALLDRLARHFSDDYERLQRDIGEYLVQLHGLRLSPIDPKIALYPEFVSTWQKLAHDLNAVITDLHSWLDLASTSLEKKKHNPLAIVSKPPRPADFATRYNALVRKANDIIEKHNLKATNHQAEVAAAKDRLADHLIAETSSKQDLPAILKEVSDARGAEAEALTALRDKSAEVDALKKRTSNIGHALGPINQYLSEFFGRKEIQLDFDESGKGYVIQRDGEIASNLSEGEKTAIAFSYFIVKTDEAGFRKEDGIVVIDDPICSFDSNFVFHCFSLIKNHFGSAGQLILLTHNFELFSLIRSWYRRIPHKSDNCRFFMIENQIIKDKRTAHLRRLDDTLLKYDSEYQYLFVRLNEFVKNGHPGYDDLYTVSNIARRFLEIFVGFKVPTNESFAKRMAQLARDGGITDVEKDRIYKLVNEYSHSPDPTSAIQHKDKTEVQDAVRLAMKLVEASDPKHHELLAKNLPQESL